MPSEKLFHEGCVNTNLVDIGPHPLALYYHYYFCPKCTTVLYRESQSRGRLMRSGCETIQILLKEFGRGG